MPRKLGARKNGKPARGAVDAADTTTSRERLLRAAHLEFAAEGLRGARVDVIAKRAKINKQLIYYYFGNKDALYLAVLEHAYSEIREKECALNLSGDDPIAAISKLVGFTFDYVNEHREFVRLLINENLLEAQWVRRSKLIKKTGSPILKLLRDTVQRGAAAGVFRKGVDPMQLYISMAGLCFFYIGNIHTLSAFFDRDFNRPDMLKERRKHVTDFVLGYLGAEREQAVAAKPKRTGAPRRRSARLALPV